VKTLTNIFLYYALYDLLKNIVRKCKNDQVQTCKFSTSPL